MPVTEDVKTRILPQEREGKEKDACPAAGTKWQPGNEQPEHEDPGNTDQVWPAALRTPGGVVRR